MGNNILEFEKLFENMEVKTSEINSVIENIN